MSSDSNLTPEGKPKAILINLSGEQDEKIAKKLGMTVRELIATRRESVRKFREIMLQLGDPLDGMDDDDVYRLMMRTIEEQQEGE